MLFGKGLRMCRFQVDCSLIVEVVLDRVENMEGKGENAGNELVDFRQCRFVDCVHCINFVDRKKEDFGLSNSVCLWYSVFKNGPLEDTDHIHYPIC